MREQGTNDQLNSLRHSLAHLLAAAVVDLYPEVKPTIGPAIDNGFYYDFDFGNVSLSETDLPKIEKRMRRILPSWHGFHRIVVTAAQAQQIFVHNPYKLELIAEISAKGEELTLYYSGPGKIPPTVAEIIASQQSDTKLGAEHALELCRGGHVDDLAKVVDKGAFALDKLAGAYWRGDEQKPMLTRIYGLAFSTKEELETYQSQLEMARERDHRKLGQELDLFVFSDLVGPGLPLFTPRGTTIRRLLTELMRQSGKKFGAQEVDIPHIAKRALYEISGHAQKFSNELFEVKSHYKTEFVMKPVNCPHHIQIYNSQPRSYRDLPIHYMQTTMQYRDEKPGQLGGLQRVRAITVDDSHIFTDRESLDQAIKNFCGIIEEVHNGLGMYGDHWVSLSLRDPKTPEKYVGDESDWQQAEAVLRNIATELQLDAEPIEGEAALYGPKLDFMYKTVTGTQTQLATIQLDFATPKRFELEFINAEGNSETPIMIHLAVLGSLERFMVILLEKTNGRLPFWLAPEQIRILTINDTLRSYVDKITTLLSEVVLMQPLKYNELRYSVDDRNESLGKKIREAEVAKIPMIFVVGPKDEAAGVISVRAEEGESKVKLADLAEFLKKL